MAVWVDSMSRVDALTLSQSSRPNPNEHVTRGNKASMVSKTSEMKEFSDHTFHPLRCQRHQGPIIYCLYTRLSRSKMKENELFSFISRGPVVLIALDSALVGFGPKRVKAKATRFLGRSRGSPSRIPSTGRGRPVGSSRSAYPRHR